MVVFTQSFALRQYIIVILVNAIAITTGMSFAWSSPMLVKLRNSTETPLHRPITEEEGSWIASIGPLCSTFTIYPLGLLLDRIGRKYCAILTCTLKLLMSTLFIYAKQPWHLILTRGIIGTMDFFICAVVPAYASEIANKDIRGSLGTFFQVFCCLGAFITMSLGPFVSYTTFNIVYAGINVLTSIPILFLPDSPYYLYSKGKKEDTLNVLKRLRRSKKEAEDEVLAYSLSMNNEKVDKFMIFKNPVLLKSLVIVFIFASSTQLVGFNAINFYLQTILISTNTKVMPEVASVIISGIQLSASFCTTAIIGRFKRRTILISSYIGILIGMVGLGTFFKVKEFQEISGFMNYLPLISLILVVFSYSVGIGSLIWVLSTELFDGPTRAVGMTACVLSSAFFIFLTTKYFSILTFSIGPAITYWLFGTMAALSCIFAYFYIPETKGKTFNEIQKAMGAEK